MAHQPISAGLLAYGMSGRIFHAPFLHTHPGFRFSAVTERHQQKAGQLYPGIRSYSTTEELIQDPDLELIVINTPNGTHFEYARQVLSAGKHVLIEKPFTTSVEDTKMLYELAKKTGRHALAYQNRRWDSDFQSVRNVIESGKLGKLTEAHFRYDRYKPLVDSTTFKESPTAGGGITMNLGPHLLDQVISLFGKPLLCRKNTAANRDGSRVDDYAFFHLIYPGQLHVYVHTSLLVAHPLPAFVVHGEKGSYIKDRTDVQESQLGEGLSPLDEKYGMEAPGSEGTLTTADDSGNRTADRIPAPKGNYAGLFDAVYGQIRDNKPYPISEEHIMWQMEILKQNDDAPAARAR